MEIAMPLARIDLVRGKSDDYRRTIGDVVYARLGLSRHSVPAASQ
jgi:hypothetical protein